MLNRRLLLGSAIGSVLAPILSSAQEAPPAAKRLMQLGPENESIAGRVGLWDVTQTVRDSPGAAPKAIALVAERRMLGSLLQETLHPASDGVGGPINRIDYLKFNRVEGRWDYVSLDTTAVVGIMPAWSYTRGDDGTIVLLFQPFATVGSGANPSGQMLRMEQVISFQGPDKDTKDQYFILADGSGTKWLAIRYAYVRRAAG